MLSLVGLLCCRGTSGIDIDLRRVDIDQCPQRRNSSDVNIFAGSDKCKERTTQVSVLADRLIMALASVMPLHGGPKRSEMWPILLIRHA